MIDWILGTTVVDNWLLAIACLLALFNLYFALKVEVVNE